MPNEQRDQAPKMGYPSNSNTSRTVKKVEVKKTEETTEERKAPEQIEGVQGVKRKKTIGRRITETFTGDDIHSVGNYLLFDVLIPAAKTTIADIVSQGVDRYFFGGEGRARSSSTSRVGGSQTSYHRMYNPAGRASRDEPRELSRRARMNHEFDEVVFATRGQAEMALERLGDLIDEFDVAMVSDLYSMVGITASFTDDKWGWTDIRSSQVRRIREGYILDLPRPRPLD